MLQLADATEDRPACRPLDRADWPAICEARLAYDLEMLRRLAGAVPAVTEVAS